VFNFNIVEVFDLFFYKGFYSINKLVLNFPEIRAQTFDPLINGIYVYGNLPTYNLDPSFIDFLYKEEMFFCFVKLNDTSVGFLGLSFELTNTEILG
jgi:hypothetical protein